MHFEPKPQNDFETFYQIYFDRCRARCPKIRGVAAKWRFEDLIPGLSDFDTRFIVDDSITLAEWHACSLQVGAVHTSMAAHFPHWARNLEHLPGLNLTEAELTSSLTYFPEFKQWTFYQGDAGLLDRIQRHLAKIDWSPRDELYHLKRVAMFFGPYQRGIDPPINLGPWEDKYALHSRLMHYFTPPVQAMVSLKLRRTVRGKFESLRLARDLLPEPGVIDRVLQCVDTHYETPHLYEEPHLGALEHDLERYLSTAWGSLAGALTLIEPDAGDTREAIHKKLAAVPVDPVESFFEGVKFARFMKGRLLFYADDIAWFDADWLIRNELRRMVSNFHDKPLKTYGLARFGAMLEPAVVLDRLRGAELTATQCEGMRAFAVIAGRPPLPGEEKAQARAVAEVYEPVLSTLESLSAALLRLQQQSAQV